MQIVVAILTLGAVTARHHSYLTITGATCGDGGPGSSYLQSQDNRSQRFLCLGVGAFYSLSTPCMKSFGID